MVLIHVALSLFFVSSPIFEIIDQMVCRPSCHHGWYWEPFSGIQLLSVKVFHGHIVNCASWH